MEGDGPVLARHSSVEVPGVIVGAVAVERRGEAGFAEHPAGEVGDLLDEPDDGPVGFRRARSGGKAEPEPAIGLAYVGVVDGAFAPDAANLPRCVCLSVRR